MTTQTIRFTTEQRDMPVTEAMADNDLRPRILQYVAAKRGLSTSAALQFIEHQLYRELGVILGRPNNPTLGHALAHLDHPHLDGPAPKGDTPNMLDTNLTELFADHRALNRVVEVMALDQNVDFMQALEQLHRGVDSEGAGSTLRKALTWTKSDPADVGETLQLLERRDETVQRTLDQALAADPQTKRLLDQGASDSAAIAGTDIGAALADPVERERRLARARRVDGSYQGDEGRKRFEDEDRANLEAAGKDKLLMMEANATRRAAEHQAAQVGAQLDQTIRATHGKRARARALEAQIAKLDVERAKLAGEVAAPARKEQALRLLDAEPGDRPLLSTVVQSRMIDLGRERPELGHEQLRRHVLEAAETGCPLTLDEEAEQWHRGIYFGLEQQREPDRQ